MSAPRKYDYPPDAELVALIEQVGVADAARSLGIPPNALSAYMHTHGIKARKKPQKAQANALPVDAEVSREEILEQRVKELEGQDRRDRKNKVYDERVANAVESAILTRSTRYSPAPIRKSKASKTKHEFVLNWSDLHAGEVVSREETGGINEYTWDIMLKRHDKLRESLFSYQDNRTYPVEQLHVFALGDMLSGSIHDELVATNEIPMAEATVQLGLDGAEWLESLTERFPRVHVTGVVGNHPRAHKKPWAKQGFDNADWTSYHVMATALKRNPRVTFDIPKANQHRITIAERWPVLLWHSDGVRSSMPGVPWGGIVRRVTALRAQYSSVGKPVNYFFSGHFHTANAVEGGTVVVNGSVKGVDEYSLKAFGGGRPAQQVLATFHPRNGLTDCSFIDLQEAA
jgi:hypothetical protein